jgi:hypothetical protein
LPADFSRSLFASFYGRSFLFAKACAFIISSSKSPLVVFKALAVCLVIGGQRTASVSSSQVAFLFSYMFVFAF